MLAKWVRVGGLTYLTNHGPPWAGVLLRGPLLQCHHQLEPVLLLAVLPAASALERVPTGQDQERHL